MTQARDFADLLNASSKIDVDKFADAAVHGRRNLIINGAMQVWQRGTSLSITTSDYRVADMWINFPGTGGAGTASRQLFTVGQTDVPGEPTTYLRHDQTTGASSAPNVQTRIEGVRTGAGQSVTLSFYARVSSGTLNIDPIIRQNFGSGGSSYVDNTPDDITVTTSWQRFTRTITLASISGKTLGSNNQLQIRLELPTSTTFTLDIALAQFEIGDTATPFELRSYGEEIILCYRYYQQISTSDRIPVTVAQADNVMSKNLLLFSPMRTQPSLSTSGAYSFDEYYVAGRTQTTAQIVRQTGNEQIVVARFPNWSGMTDGNRGNPGVVYNAITRIDAEL